VGATLVLTDLGSTNGTTVNDVFVHGPVELRHLAAVLGGGADTAMRASETLTLGVLDADLLRALAQSEPSVAAGLTGRRSSVAPTGVRSSRLTFGGSGGRRLATLDGAAGTSSGGLP
jgi:hypothetical protein